MQGKIADRLNSSKGHLLLQLWRQEGDNPGLLLGSRRPLKVHDPAVLKNQVENSSRFGKQLNISARWVQLPGEGSEKPWVKEAASWPPSKQPGLRAPETPASSVKSQACRKTETGTRVSNCLHQAGQPGQNLWQEVFSGLGKGPILVAGRKWSHLGPGWGSAWSPASHTP